MKELEDTNPINEAEGQSTTNASCMELLEDGCDSETSTMRESSVDVDDGDLEISSFWLHESYQGFKKCLENKVALT